MAAQISDETRMATKPDICASIKRASLAALKTVLRTVQEPVW